MVRDPGLEAVRPERHARGLEAHLDLGDAQVRTGVHGVHRVAGGVHDQQQAAIKVINELKAEAGKPAWNWEAAPTNSALEAAVAAQAQAGLSDAYKVIEKQARQTRVGEAKLAALTALALFAAIADPMPAPSMTMPASASRRLTASATALAISG